MRGPRCPFARRRARWPPVLPRRDGAVRGRRDHGAAPPRPRGGRGAVPSGSAAHQARAQNAAEFPRGKHNGKRNGKRNGEGIMKQITVAEAIQRTVEHREVFHDEMLHVMRQIMRGELTPAQIAGFIIGLRVKKETIGEIAAAAQVMRELATHVEVRDRSHLVDTCGTGGDAAHTFHVSPGAWCAAAAAGAKVAKHIGRWVSSSSGSAEVLEALGANIAMTPDVLRY